MSECFVPQAYMSITIIIFIIEPDPCTLAPEHGLCMAVFVRYYYNVVTQTCQKFQYGGCGGNENNFDTQQECEDKCSGKLIEWHLAVNV